MCATGADWERGKREAAADAPIDEQNGPYGPNDTAAVSVYWNTATITRERGRPPVTVKRPTLNMRVDAEVLDAFKATGQGWRARINDTLKCWVWRTNENTMSSASASIGSMSKRNPHTLASCRQAGSMTRA